MEAHRKPWGSLGGVLTHYRLWAQECLSMQFRGDPNPVLYC